MNSARIVYELSANATPETESGALAAVYRIILDCRAKKKTAPSSRPDDAKVGSKHDSRATKSVHDDSNVFAAVRELYSRLPEARTLAPYELQGTLWLLPYTNELAPEAEITAAMEVARGD